MFIRKDPPFDTAYAHLTQQLDLVKDRTLVLNDPRGLRDANEKLFAFHFSEFMPLSLVSAEPREILEFVRDVGGKAVLKPLDGAGGSGVVALGARGQEHARPGRHPDRGGPAPRAGPAVPRRGARGRQARAHARRRAARRDPARATRGRHPRQHPRRRRAFIPPSSAPRSALWSRASAPRLREHGLWFVGLDLIGGKLIEVNVTSPTGIQELGRHRGDPPEQAVIAWVERRVTGR